MKTDMTECTKTETLATPSDIVYIHEPKELNTPLMQKIKMLSPQEKAQVSEFIDRLLV